MSQGPKRVWWHRLIVQADLGPRSAAVKSLLHAIADHVDKDSIAFPGRKRLRQESGLGGDALSAAIKRAEGLGVLRVQRTRGGAKRTNHYWLRRSEFERRKHDWNCPDPGQYINQTVRNEDSNDPMLRSELSDSTASNGPEAGQEPSHRSTPTNNPIKSDEKIEVSEENGMDERKGTTSGALALALSEYGVMGPMLGRLAEGLAANGIGVERIALEVAELKKDGSARDISAVLVARLAKQAGIKTGASKKRTGNRKPVEPAMSEAVASLESQRRAHIRSLSGGSVNGT